MLGPAVTSQWLHLQYPLSDSHKGAPACRETEESCHMKLAPVASLALCHYIRQAPKDIWGEGRVSILPFLLLTQTERSDVGNKLKEMSYLRFLQLAWKWKG